jgi:hypothetical protein
VALDSGPENGRIAGVLARSTYHGKQSARPDEYLEPERIECVFGHVNLFTAGSCRSTYVSVTKFEPLRATAEAQPAE